MLTIIRNAQSITVPNILIRCFVTGEAVPTGLDTETVAFETLPDIAIPVQCLACGRTHHWRPRSAWVGGRNKRPDRTN
jgi:hypothetical protein